MSLKMLGEKGVGHFFIISGLELILFANPVSFNTIYHTLNNVAPYIFNSFSIERNILKNINLQNNGFRLQYGGCHNKS